MFSLERVVYNPGCGRFAAARWENQQTMSQHQPTRIIIEEQGLRDGFQSEKTVVPTDRKLEIIDTLVEAGVSRIQICSFVHPKYVPQMADAEALCKAATAVRPFS